MDELAFAFGSRPDLLGALDFILRKGNRGGCDGWIPKLVIVGHGDSPVCHRTPRIKFGHVLKCVLGGGVSEGVKESHASIELLLNGWCAGHRKRYFSQLLRR